VLSRWGVRRRLALAKIGLTRPDRATVSPTETTNPPRHGFPARFSRAARRVSGTILCSSSRPVYMQTASPRAVSRSPRAEWFTYLGEYDEELRRAKARGDQRVSRRRSGLLQPPGRRNRMPKRRSRPEAGSLSREVRELRRRARRVRAARSMSRKERLTGLGFFFEKPMGDSGAVHRRRGAGPALSRGEGQSRPKNAGHLLMQGSF